MPLKVRLDHWDSEQQIIKFVSGGLYKKEEVVLKNIELAEAQKNVLSIISNLNLNGESISGVKIKRLYVERIINQQKKLSEEDRLNDLVIDVYKKYAEKLQKRSQAKQTFKNYQSWEKSLMSTAM